MNKRILCSLGLLLAGMALASAAGADGDSDSDSDSDRHHQGPIHGAYIAQLDLNPAGLMRIEGFGFVLHKDGTVIASSEHEVDDVESAGIGVWKRLRGGKIGVGVFNFRIGTAGGCAAIFGIVPPDNCVLKLGATLDREKGGGLVGNAFLSFETLDGDVFTIPVPLPIVMERLSLEDFPRPMATP